MCGFTPEASKRICNHMNEDHAHTIYAMAKSTVKKSSTSSSSSSSPKISNAKMKSISNNSYCISFVLCDGELCEMRNETIEFKPPLNDVKEARTRMIKEHNRVLTPPLSYLFTPLNTLIIIICAFMGYATHVLTLEKLITLLDDPSSTLSPLNIYFVQPIFQSSHLFTKLVHFFWYLSIVVHSAEAIYFGYLCRSKLKIGWAGTIKWCTMIVCVGFFVGNRLQELLDVQSEAEKQKKK